MAEQLYLSYWLRNFNAENMLQHFEKLLRAFPFSALAQRSNVFRIYALDYTEPPLIEQRFEPFTDPAELIAAAREFLNPDCSYLLQGYWDLWQWEDEWKLMPSPVTLICHGPVFESDSGDHLRVEAGLDSHFLPQPQYPGGASKVQSNIQGLLRLAHELDDILPAENRRLWSESGENFAGRLQAALTGYAG